MSELKNINGPVNIVGELEATSLDINGNADITGNLYVNSGGVVLQQAYNLNLGVSGYDLKMPNTTSIILTTAGTTALTLDSSQDATFAGNINTGSGPNRFTHQQNAGSRLELYNNRQDAGNVEVYRIAAYNSVEVAGVHFYRGSGGDSGYTKIFSKKNNASSLEEVVQFGANDGLTTTFAGNVLFNENIDLADGKSANFGNGDDLQIYHDGSNSYINDSGTGNLLLRRGLAGGIDISGTGATINGDLTIPEFIYHAGDTGTNIQMTSGQMVLKNSGGKYINLHSNGIMYFDASAYQFYTGNATFAGTLTIPSYIYHTGDPSTDTYFGFNGNDNFTVVTAGGNGLVIDSNRDVTFTGSLIIPAKIIHSGDTNTYFGFDLGADTFRVVAGGTEKLRTASAGIEVNGELQCDTLDVDGSGNLSGTLTIPGGFATTILDGDNVVVQKPDYSLGGWARFFGAFKEHDGTLLTGIGAYGSNNVFSYGFIGAAYNNFALKFESDKKVTFGGSISVGGHAVDDILVAGDTFANDDDHLMTAAAIEDKILSYGYGTGGGSGNGDMLLGTAQDITADKEFQDGIKARFGNDADLQIYHNNTDAFINNDTGDLYIKNFADGKDIILQSDNSTGGMDAYMTIDGSDQIVRVHKPLWIGDYITHIGDTNTFFGFSAADTFVVHAGATGHAELTIDSTTATFAGNVALGGGALQSYHANVTSALALDDQVSVFTRANQMFLGNNFYYGASDGGIAIEADKSSLIQIDRDKVRFFFAASVSAGASASLVEKFRLDDAGKLTIPGEIEGGSLDINGNADISGTTAMGGNTLINAQLAVNSTSVNAANKLEVHGQARVNGTMMIGDSSISNTTSTGQLHIKNTGEATIRLEDSDNSNLAFDVKVNEGEGFIITETIGGEAGGDNNRLVIAETTGNATFSGDVIVNSSGSSKFTGAGANFIATVENTGTGTSKSGLWIKTDSTWTSALILKLTAGTSDTSIMEVNPATVRIGGGTITQNDQALHLPDNKKIGLGDSSDLQIYHDGNFSRIDADGTGDLIISQKTADKDIILASDDGSGGETTYFYLDGSIVENRFAKATRHSDNIIAKFGDGNDLNIYSDGTNGVISVETDDADLIFQSDNGAGGVQTYFFLDGSTEQVEFNKSALWTDNDKALFGTGSDLQIDFDGTNGQIQQTAGDLYITNSANDKDIIFQSDDGSGGVTAYLTIAGADGHTVANKEINFLDNVKGTFGHSSDLQIYHDGSNSYIVDYGTGDMLNYYSNDWKLIKLGSGEVSIWAQTDAGVKLFHNNSLKLETTAYGAKTYYTATSNTDGDAAGDIVYLGETTTVAGKIYYYTSGGGWELTDADAESTAKGMLGVALGTSSGANGMLLKGMVTLDHDPGTIADTLFLSTAAGAAQSTAPSGSGDIVRVIGYCLNSTNGQIYFNPDGAFVEVA